MKKSKIFVVIALAVVLCVVSVTSTTFSWFSRPKELQGDRLLFSGKTYDVSTGNGVSFVTYESTDGGETYGTTPVTSFSYTGLGTNSRKMYRTDITNSGAQAQSVSLYLNNLNIPESNNGYFYIGVNSPLKTYKIYGKDMSDGYQTLEANKIDNPANTLRLYFCPTPDGSSEPDSNWKSKTLEVVYQRKNDSTTHYDKLETIDTDHLYFKDIPADVSWFYFHVELSKESYQQTQTFDNPAGDGLTKTCSKMYQLKKDDYSGRYNNAQAEIKSFTGANIVKYYNTITIPVGKTFDAKLIKDIDYIGKEIEYYSTGDCYSLSGSVITANKTGTGRLYTKAISENTNNSYQMETVVNVVDAPPVGVSHFDMAPIVTNVKVGGVADADPTTESVYWYIKNNSSSKALTYTVGSLDLAL